MHKYARGEGGGGLHVLGHDKPIFKDLVHLIASFYSQSKYNKPLEC